MEIIIIDAGPFIHLNQVGRIHILKKFAHLYTTTNVVSEIRPDHRISIDRIHQWKNFKCFTIKDQDLQKIENIISQFHLHKGESDVLCLACQYPGSILLTDDLNARKAAKSLGIEVHGSVGVITYAFYNKWISRQEAVASLILLYEQSNLFITSAIIEKAIREIKH